MHCQLSVVAGPPGTGKTRRLLARYRTALATQEPGAALWLAPTWRAAAEFRSRLLGGECDGCLSPGIMTFDQFAEAVLQVAPVRPISRLMKRQLVRQLIDQLRLGRRLRHFGPIAETGGLVDLVCDLISDFKRLEIWPEHFHEACRSRGITDKDAELLEIYDGYQQCLREHELYDAEGRFWSARDLLDQGRWPPAERLQLVVADGFTDFTRTQHEILEILARRAAEILISLPLEEGSRREALFSKPRKTLAELRRRHERLTVEALPRPAEPRWPALAHIEQGLFGNPRHARAAQDTAGVEILAAARRLGEIELIGGRIKRLLCQGDPLSAGRPVPPGQIALVFRSLEDAAGSVAEVFDALGIPAVLDAGQALQDSPALAALVGLLQLDARDWPFRSLLAVLGSSYFQPEWPEWQAGKAAVAAERAVRRLQVPHGRKVLLEQLAAVSARQPDASEDGGLGDGELKRCAAVALPLLARLAAAFDALPERATLAGWGAAWRRLAADTGLIRVTEQAVPAAGAARLTDDRAWNRLMEVLDAEDRLAAWLAQEAPVNDRRQALGALMEILSSERVGQIEEEAGRVRVLSAASVRALRVPYLFVAGLSEKAFPPPDREDRLYDEAEAERLIDAGLPLVARNERSREEMLLFYEVLTRATRRLYLSYPALDESGQPLSPSPFLHEVEQACGPGRIARTELSDLSPVPVGDQPLSAAEFRLQAVSAALRGDVSLLAGLIRQEPADGLAENVLGALQLGLLRRDRKGFGPAEGMLDGEPVRQHLAARFSERRAFSATELEQYAACPYQYFLDRVLRLQPPDDLGLGAERPLRGRLAHQVLAAFHRRVNRALGAPGSPLRLPEEQRQRLLNQTLREELDREPATPLAAAMREVDRRVLKQWMADYAEQCERYDRLCRQCQVPPAPEFFEASFGRVRQGDDPISTEQPLEVTAGDVTILISGRIDRIDVGQAAGHAVFNILDYKTGGSSGFGPDAIAAGKALQLPLYVLAVSDLLLIERDPIPWQAGFWYLKENGFKPGRALRMYKLGEGGIEPEAKWEEIRGRLAETVAGLVCGIRGGRFPVCNDDRRCTGYCPYSTLCRIGQIRALEKTWQPAPQD